MTRILWKLQSWEPKVKEGNSLTTHDVLFLAKPPGGVDNFSFLQSNEREQNNFGCLNLSEGPVGMNHYEALTCNIEPQPEVLKYQDNLSYFQGLKGSWGRQEEDGDQGCRQRRHGARRARRGDRGRRHEVASKLSSWEVRNIYIRSNFCLSHSRIQIYKC